MKEYVQQAAESPMKAHRHIVSMNSDTTKSVKIGYQIRTSFHTIRVGGRGSLTICEAY